MTFEEARANAVGKMGKWCKACPDCDGRACGGAMPGPGAKGIGDTAIRNRDAWKRMWLNMDTINEARDADTSAVLFGRRFAYPIFAGAVGSVQMHYGELYTDDSYNRELLTGCAEAGICAFVGDGPNPQIVKDECEVISGNGGTGIPVIKPWAFETIAEKLELVRKSGAFAVAMDVDAAGLPFLKGLTPKAGSKSVLELEDIISEAEIPFIVKGIMTEKGAIKAKNAGAAGIIVSNHGGRVLDGCPATADVLEVIVDAVGDDMTILIDGGIRTGADVLRALALGADGVVMARPFVTAVYGGGRDGATALAKKVGGELKEAMEMCGVFSLKQINREVVIKD